LRPDFVEAHYNLGVLFNDRSQLDEAIASYQRVLALNPAYTDARNNLGNTLKERGEFTAALAAFRQALAATPDRPSVHSNLIFTLYFDPESTEPMIAEEQQRWNQRFSEPWKRRVPPHDNHRDPDRRLRIGYVSPDFWDHVVGRNLRPLFQYRDPRHFEVVCYSGVARPDELTAEFQRHADLWRSTTGVSNDALAEKIRADNIDILVDLSLHSSGNRLAVFTRQPAPVQVSFAGYPESTGVDAIGYRMSDRWLEAEMRQRQPAEQVFLLDSFWCYDPCGVEMKVNPLPAQSSGRITFGCLSNFNKVNEPVLRLWARVLKEVATARLVILCDEGSHRQRTADFLAREGLAADRLEFLPRGPRREYLELYHRLDIALDPFPYNGHTTSLDALWMGVPVVSLAGERPLSRAGVSILNNLGLAELVAYLEDEYVSIANRLSHDLPHLAELRHSLRARMEASVLMDAPRFADNIESAYRAMWRQWCANKAGA
jgi:predicted O-linked N-acetylglucosamine transferase (SPINDLY family)